MELFPTLIVVALSDYMPSFIRGLFNEEMLGEELSTNSRTIFPEEFNDDIVMEDTKEWVQKGIVSLIDPRG